jgi:hypothetical protein
MFSANTEDASCWYLNDMKYKKTSESMKSKLRRTGFHEIRSSDSLGFKDCEVCRSGIDALHRSAVRASWNPSLQSPDFIISSLLETGYHQIRSSGRHNLMKSKLPELGFHHAQSLKGSSSNSRSRNMGFDSIWVEVHVYLRCRVCQVSVRTRTSEASSCPCTKHTYSTENTGKKCASRCHLRK